MTTADDLRREAYKADLRAIRAEAEVERLRARLAEVEQWERFGRSTLSLAAALLKAAPQEAAA